MRIRYGTTGEIRLGAAPAPAPAPAPVDEKTLAALAKILGCDATPEAVLAAVQALLGGAAQADQAARRLMTPREIALCKDKRVSPAKYVKAREELNARRIGGKR